MSCGDSFGNQSPAVAEFLRGKLMQAQARRDAGIAGNGSAVSQTRQAMVDVPPPPKIQAPHQRGKRAALWLAYTAIVPPRHDGKGNASRLRRTKTVLQWLALSIPKFLEYLRVRRGGRVLLPEYVARMKSCISCAGVLRRAVRNGKGTLKHELRLYCRLCECGETARAELQKKNWLRGWDCPQGRHEGSQEWKHFEDAPYVILRDGTRIDWVDEMAKEGTAKDEPKDEDGGDTTIVAKCDGNKRPVADVGSRTQSVGV